MLDLHLEMQAKLLVELAGVTAAQHQRTPSLEQIRENAHIGASSAANEAVMIQLTADEARVQAADSTSSWRRPAAVSS
jgi:hypothetical protein